MLHQIDKATRDGLETMVLPPHDVLVPGADNVHPSDEHDELYNRLCTERITAQLRSMGPGAMIRTRYPKDDNASEDVVTLDEDGAIVVLDAGSR